MNSEFGDSDCSLGFIDHSQSGWDYADLLAQLGHSIFSGHVEHDAIVGTPGTDTHDWVHQTTPFTCDVVSQEMILHEFGVNASEAQLTYDAAAHGWLTDHGTSPQDMANLLEFHGVHTHTNYNGNIEALTSELAHGHKVIVGVDSSELWNPDSSLFDLFRSHEADHALVVTGLDMSDASHPKVFVNDPGDPHGAGKPYALDQFLEAWGGSGNMYVATDSAPPHLADHSIFGTSYHPETGMYMDEGFWMSLLKGIGVDVTKGWAAHAGDPFHGNFQTNALPNPWEGMSSTDRNNLFTQI
jgi:hypothetical protein